MFNAMFVLIWSLISPHNEPDLKILELIEINSQIPVVEAIKVAAIESSFNPEALSNKGAVGLFQITPIAFEEVQRKGICPTVSTLIWEQVQKDPAINIFVGTCFIRLLKDLYEGDMELVLTHYNGGGRAVKNLLAGIPFEETKNYLRIYRRLKTELILAGLNKPGGTYSNDN